MKRKPGTFTTLLFTLTLAAGTPAQTAAPPSGATGVSPPAHPMDSGLPPMPDIKDPMLEPVPPAQNALSSWKDALRHIHMRSTGLHIAQATVAQDEGLSRSALAKALPQLSTSGSAVHQFFLPNPNPFGVPGTQYVGTVDLKQPLLNLPAWHGIGTTKVVTRKDAATEKDTERTLLAAVAQDAVVVITNERIAESNRVSLASAMSTADLTRRRAALGASNAVDVLRAEQDVSTARALVVSGDETLRAARETLGADLGYTGQWGVAPDIRVEDLERTAAQICKPVQSIDGRADVRAAKLALEAAHRDRKGVDYLFAPTVDLSSQLGYFSFEFRSPSGGHIAWSASATATWLIFDGGDRYGQQHQKDAAISIAKEQLTQTERAATLQAIQAERSILVARATLDVSEKTRDIAKEQARLSRIAFMSGSGTSFDLVDSARRLREAEIDLLNKQFGVFQAEIAAFLAKADCSI